MVNSTEQHHLLILSQHYEIYHQLIVQANLPGLVVKAVNKPDQVLSDINSYDLVFGEPSLISQIVDYLAAIKWIQASWAGIEPLLANSPRRDYILTNARNVYGSMMCEYVFGYILLIERRIIQRYQAQLDRKWDDQPFSRLKGKTVGLLGVGTIGSYLAKTAHHFGMRVHGLTRQSETCVDVDRYFHGPDWRLFTTGLDYLVCSLPGTQATRSMVDKDFLAALPSKAWIINIGRGSSIDEQALVCALSNHAIAGAVLDVFQEEPLDRESPLWSSPNTYITFHTAARNYPPDIAALFIENYKRFIQGIPLMYKVSFEHGY